MVIFEPFYVVYDPEYDMVLLGTWPHRLRFRNPTWDPFDLAFKREMSRFVSTEFAWKAIREIGPRLRRVEDAARLQVRQVDYWEDKGIAHCRMHNNPEPAPPPEGRKAAVAESRLKYKQ